MTKGYLGWRGVIKLDKCKAQLKVLKNKEEREELQGFINSFDEPKNVVAK